jgi:hypothetical protein
VVEGPELSRSNRVLGQVLDEQQDCPPARAGSSA